jgi:proton-dependent oligopeptide transporter, POT family
VWFLAAFGGTLADRLGFRRSLSLAYFILSCSYFILGSLGSSWIAPLRAAVPLALLVTVVLMLPALGIALVKPCVVGTTARASKENVRSIGYSIYYTLVNIGGAAGPYMASYVHHHMKVENVFRVAALSVFLMFIAVLLFFKEPRRSNEAQAASLGEAARNFSTVLRNPKFMLFLLIFSGYWIVYWQEFIILPLYVHNYINPKTDTELMLVTGPLTVIALQMIVSLLTRKIPAFRAITVGTLVSALAWVILIVHPTVPMVIVTLFAVSIGEIVQSPRYYEYISRLAPPGQQGTYMGFAFLPIGIGSLFGGWFGGMLIHHFGEVQQRPERIWWAVTGVGVTTALLLWIYDRTLKPGRPAATAAAENS